MMSRGLGRRGRGSDGGARVCTVCVWVGERGVVRAGCGGAGRGHGADLASQLIGFGHTGRRDFAGQTGIPAWTGIF